MAPIAFAILKGHCMNSVCRSGGVSVSLLPSKPNTFSPAQELQSIFHNSIMPPMNAQAQPFPRTQTNLDATGQVLAQFLAMSLENQQTSALVHQPQLNRGNIVGEFARYFGSENRLENWQRLCRDVGIVTTLTSMNQCKKALQNVWVNIFDLIAAVHENQFPRLFPNEVALRKYTIKSKKIFPKRKAKEGGPIRALLAHIS